MATSIHNKKNIDRIITYWFGNSGIEQRHWFIGSPQVDQEIQTQFGDLIVKARKSQLDSWKDTARGSLALIFLLDQFPRDIHRNTEFAFSSDAKAQEIATLAIAKGFDRQLDAMQSLIMFIPIMHSEQLISQVAAVALLEELYTRCSPESEAGRSVQRAIEAARRNRAVILRFGRFPARNFALGRACSAEELEILKDYPWGF